MSSHVVEADSESEKDICLKIMNIVSTIQIEANELKDPRKKKGIASSMI